MSIGDALSAVNEAIQEADSLSSTVRGAGIEPSLGFNGYIAPAHPGMALENVQQAEPPRAGPYS